MTHWKKNLFKVYLQFVNSTNGFSIIELLVAMIILSFIVMAFTPLLTGSIMRLKYAGDKTEALYEGQSIMEVNIAERITTDGDNVLAFSFDGNAVEIKVPGDSIYVDFEVEDARAWLSGFVPFLPLMYIIEPSLVNEGYHSGLNGFAILTIEGLHTDFEKAATITIYEEGNPSNEGSFQLGTFEQTDGENTERAIFTLGKELTVSKNPYIATIEWDMLGVGTISVKTRFFIHRPDIVAVGSGQNIYVSPNLGYNWNERSYTKGGTGTLTDVIRIDASTFAAVAVTGRTIIWNLDKDPEVSGSRSDTALNALAYGNGNYIAVGSSGKMIIGDQKSFLESPAESVYASDGCEFVDIKFNSDNNFYALGDNGLIVRSNGVVEWEKISKINGGVVINGIALDNATVVAAVVVGGSSTGEAVIYYKSDINNGSESWEVNNLSGHSTLNSVIYDGTRFVAVGDNGTVIHSLDGVVWEVFGDINTLNITNDLYAIDWGNLTDTTDTTVPDYVAVGNNGEVIIYDATEGKWVKGQGVSDALIGVAIRTNN